jgi:hypothetical protein
MTDGQQCVITVCEFVQMLWLEHQLTMETKSQIHTFDVLKIDEKQFMYAPGTMARPPKIRNFLPELNILHCLLCLHLIQFNV